MSQPEWLCSSLGVGKKTKKPNWTKKNEQFDEHDHSGCNKFLTPNRVSLGVSYDDSLTSHHSQVGFDRKVQVFDPKPERGNVIGQVNKFWSNPTQFDLCRPLISTSQSTAVIFYSL